MLDFPVRYRGIELNTVDMVPGVGLRKGNLLEVFDLSDVQGVGYTEKKAQRDGLDASDVYLGARYVRLQGVTYGEDIADLHDRLQEVRTALTPTAAYVSDIPHYGYVPLEFTLPTNDLVNFPPAVSGDPHSTRDLELRARPRGQPTFQIRRDGGASNGADPSRGGGVSWQAVLECKDPRMYVRPDTWVYWNADVTPAVPLTNRGDYPAPLDILIEVPASSAGGSVHFWVGASDFIITIPDATTTQILRYSGDLQVLTLESNSVEVLRMDLFALQNNTLHPYILPGGLTTYRIDVVGATLSANTRFMYSESFA